MMLDLKNKSIEKLAKEYNLKLNDKNKQLDSIATHKREARRTNSEWFYNSLRKDEIHHQAERQMIVQFLADLEALDIDIEDK